MSTIYGESLPMSLQDDGYANGGGIALYAANDEGTISGGSGDEGSYNSFFRIYWTITKVGDIYTGGISGNDWFSSEPLSPFYEISPDQIWENAQDGVLDEYFAPWNSGTTDDQKIQFLNFLRSYANGCYKLAAG